jgi:filamentous hemagglutinin family N-terminal domain protein
MIGKITIEDNSTDSIKDNIKAVGETISGKIVNLVASNDVFLQAAMNTSEKLENEK